MEPMTAQQAFIDTSTAREANLLYQPIEQLKSFCRGELSAIETYRQVMAIVPQEWILVQLRENLRSHEERVRLLKERVFDLGGEPPESSGPWGAFANAVEGVATVMGEKTALAILEEGERHGLADYREDLANLDYDSQRLVEERVIPEQARTHMSLHDIVRILTS